MATTITHRDNFIWLFFALIFLLFSGAVFAQLDSELGRQLVNASLTVTMFIAVWSMETKQSKWIHPKIFMSMVIISALIGDNFLDDSRFAVVHMTMVILFLSLTTFLAARQTMFSGYIDGNKIVGAICIYMLIGVIWAFAYLLVEELFPGSMNGLDHKQWQNNLEDVVYYSMVTLTTLGYGDITPDQPLVRFLAYMESITGIFYTTVLVASLIGVRLAEYKRKENDTEQTDNGVGDKRA